MQNHDVSHWNEGWEYLDNVALENKNALHNMLNSSYYIGIQNFLEKKFGSLEGINTVELGCGRGVASAALATQGANVTLVDLSDAALTSAKEFYANNGLNTPNCNQADVFNLPSNLEGKFDVVSSFGLVEHFEGEERLEVFKSHVKILRAGGCAVILVPNRQYLPGQFYKFISERLGTWPYGFERDFTPRELLKIGQLAGLTDCKIIGSEVLYDLYSHTVLKLPGFLKQITRQRIRGPVTAKYDKSGKYTMTTHSKKSLLKSPLDAQFGFMLVLLGQNSN